MKTLYSLILSSFFLFCSSWKNVNKKPVKNANVIEKNLSLWRSKKIDYYQFTQRVTCFCLVEFTRPKVVVVKNRKVISVDGTPVDLPGHTSYKTIDDFFAYMKEVSAQRPERFKYSFDSVYGFPTFFSYDISKMIADEERSYRFTDFKPL